jgi:chromate transporter
VDRRGWLDDETLGELIALSQLLPGPASSQTGFLIGITLGGVIGGFAAWAGFTLPSAILMTAFGAGLNYARGPIFSAALHGLQLSACAVVAHAVVTMYLRLCTGFVRTVIAAVALAIVWFAGGSFAQFGAIGFGALAGILILRNLPPSGKGELRLAVGTSVAHAALAAFVVGFAGLFALAHAGYTWAQVAYAFYSAGALVFGGGHVVLPLLQSAVVRPGWVSESVFLSGYGAAQAIPGPLFTFAAFLGFVLRVHPNGVAGAALCLTAIFFPGLSLALAVAPFWQRLRTQERARALFAGVNSAVVGLLGAALFRAASVVLGSWPDFIIAAVAFAVLLSRRFSPVWVVLGTAFIEALRAAL